MLLFIGAIDAGLVVSTLYAKVHVPAVTPPHRSGSD